MKGCSAVYSTAKVEMWWLKVSAFVTPVRKIGRPDSGYATL
jgi:hypothetical protein